MPRTSGSTTVAVLVLAFVVLGGCAETPRQRAQRFEPLLSAAGFHMVLADTPQRQHELASHTPLKVRYYFANGKPLLVCRSLRLRLCVYR